MEYDIVQLAEDFITEDKLKKLKLEKKEGGEINVAKWNEEINLLYVAITRTKGLLRIPEILLPGNFPPSPHIQVIKEKREYGNDPFDSEFQGRENNERNRTIRIHKKEQAYSYTEKRMMHKNAYERWTPELDAALKEMYYSGKKLGMIAAHFGRKEGAILTRLKKLGCVQFES
jgi:hypothetical protein